MYINVACDRALEIAYQRKFNYIDGDIAKATVRYLSNRAENRKSKSLNRRLLGSIAAMCCLIFVTAIAAFFYRYNSDQNFSKEVITVKKVPLTTGQATEMPVRSVLSTPVKPEPPATKEDLALEPIQPDQTTVSAETSVPSSDSSDVEQKSVPRMTHSVQVGAFRRAENAEDLIAQLELKGYSAQIVEIPDSQGRFWFTVRIGDHLTLESAEKQAGMFMEEENMKAYVRPYNAF
jgi:cell division septation protein DedD